MALRLPASLIDAILELLRIEELGLDGVAIEDPSLERIDSLQA